MLEKLPFELILASGSPRRKAFLEELNIPFTVDVRPIKEHYPTHLKKEEIPLFLSELKASAFADIQGHQVVLTGDTVVWHEGEAIGKPANHEEAFAMLQSLSGKTHEVISAFTLKSKQQTISKFASCQVGFKALSDDEINYYITHFSPYDKAGAYGIQEWIGQIGVSQIQGSFYTVMGMPVDALYAQLMRLSENWPT
jgi:septum formation protein